jgi:Fur family transcriptional regulator, peroxide stress response regulator
MEIQEHKRWIDSKMSSFKQKCKTSGLRLTPQRLEIYHELVSVKDHPSAYTLHKRLQKRMPTLSLDTVYRTLLTFEQYELISRVNTQESQARFDAETEPHHHLICSVCKQIVDVKSGSFDGLNIPEEIAQWGQVKTKSVVFYGICNKCLKKSDKRLSH